MDEILNKLSKYSYKPNTNKIDKDLLSNCKYNIGKYNYGSVINKLKGDVAIYEVYSFVINEATSETVSLLLYKQFNNKNEASKYYEYLANLLGHKDINYLLEICENK